MWWRKLRIGAGLLAVAVGLSGCVVFKSQPTAKQKKQSVVITVIGCASQNTGAPAGSCTNEGNSSENAASGPDQVFLGFQVPAGSKAPKSFSAKTGPGSGKPTLKFTPSKSYASQLQKNDPAKSGERWVGYWTAYFTYSGTSGKQNFTAKVPFALAKNAKGTFKYQVDIGGRTNESTTTNPKQKINCMGSLTTVHLNGSKTEAWICVDQSATGKLKLH